MNQEEGGPRKLSDSELENIKLTHDSPIEWIAKHKEDTNGNPLMSLAYILCKAFKSSEEQISSKDCQDYALKSQWFSSVVKLFTTHNKYKKLLDKVENADEPLRKKGGEVENGGPLRPPDHEVTNGGPLRR